MYGLVVGYGFINKCINIWSEIMSSVGFNGNILLPIYFGTSKVNFQIQKRKISK